MEKTNIIIIGAGKGGTAILDLLQDDPNINILGIADVKNLAAGMRLARTLGIPTTTLYKSLLNLTDLNFIIDVSGNKTIGAELMKSCPKHAQVISGECARFLWQNIEGRLRRKETIEQLLFQYQSIYDVGLKMSSSKNLASLLFYTLEDATKLTTTPAGSIALFDEIYGQMSLGAVKGFSENFSKKIEWKLRKGGLTSAILNNKTPLVISDVLKHTEFDNPIMLREGIRSLIATPLITEGKVVGILYVNDFIARSFTNREVALLSLLGNFAASTIANAKLLENVMRTAITDELTGISNHRYFMQRLTHETSRAQRYLLSFTVAILDIDDFKIYNDTYGHLCGNEVLKSVSYLLKKHCRETDVIARYGGEEFCIIMPETSPKEALRHIQRLRKIIEDYPFNQVDNTIIKKQPHQGITVSAGIAAYPQNSTEAISLIEYADKALYESKRSGKNKCTISKNGPVRKEEKKTQSD